MLVYLFFLHVCILDSTSSRYILTLGSVMFAVSLSPISVAGLGSQIVPKQPKNLGVSCIHRGAQQGPISSSDAFSVSSLSRNIFIH